VRCARPRPVFDASDAASEEEACPQVSLLDAYPNPTPEDIRAPMLLAADAMAHREAGDAD